MSQGQLTCYTRRDNQSLRLVMDGAIDIATAEHAMGHLQRVMAEHGPTVVVDASRVNFIDSRGVGTLLAAAKQARDAGGQIYLHNPALPVTRILEACGLTTFFPPAPEPAPIPTPNGGRADAAPAAKTASASGTARPRTRSA